MQAYARTGKEHMKRLTIWNDGGIRPTKQVKKLTIEKTANPNGQAGWRIVNSLGSKKTITRFKTRDDVCTAYNEIASHVIKEGTEFTLTPSERTALMMWRNHRQERLEQGKDSMTLDKAILYAIESENEQDGAKPLIFDLLREFEKFKEKEAQSKGTRQALDGHNRMIAKVKRFLEPINENTAITFFDDRERLEELEEELHDKIIGRVNGKPSQGSKVDYRKKLSIFINWLVKNGYLQRNMIDALHKITASDPPMEIYTVKEMRQLLELAGKEIPHAMPWLVMAGFCGIRRRELTRIKWSDINLDERIIRIEASVAKTTQRRIVPIPEVAYKWLELAIKGGIKANGFIIPYETEQRREEAQSRHIKRLESLGFSWKRNALRHSAASYACAYSENYNEVANWMGHDVSTLKRHYRSVVTKKNAQEWFEMMP